MIVPSWTVPDNVELKGLIGFAGTKKLYSTDIAPNILGKVKYKANKTHSI